MLIILQGESGSGKSTLAREISAKTGAIICSTDDFFCQNGIYNFVGEKLAEYHKKNQDKALALLQDGKSVIIDNTNVNAWQARPYVEFAYMLGIEVQFIRATGNYMNVHGVPSHVVERMKSSLEPLSVDSCLNAKYPWE